MSAHQDKNCETQPHEKSAWERPELFLLDVSEAKGGAGNFDDGLGNFQPTVS